ncbi:MAG: methionyl-tRNA formyltransferase [Proteobacteria bacterium]|nr:methionyl-tRNA formyltransferase [Pseudomonadota bacterium]
MRIVFMGTPEYVIAPCEALHKDPRWDLIAVLTPPARSKGRSKKLVDPPLARWAKEQDLLCLQPARLAGCKELAQLATLSCDLIVTAAYGQILDQECLSLPLFGVINIHPSKLPLYRGATPVQEAILQGDRSTAVSILHTTLQLDSGPVIITKDITIKDHQRADALLALLFNLSAPLLLKACQMIAENPNNPIGIPQDEQKASYCGKLNKQMGWLDFSSSAKDLYRRYRAFYPWPGSYTFLCKKRVIIEDMKPLASSHLKPFELAYNASTHVLCVGTRCNDLALISLKSEGKPSQSGQTYWHGLAHLHQKDHSLFFDTSPCR